MGEFTGIITLTQVNDGQDGQLYYIESGTNSILKTQEGKIEDGLEKALTSFSPDPLQFSLFNGKGEKQQLNNSLNIYCLLKERTDWIKAQLPTISEGGYLVYDNGIYSCILGDLISEGFEEEFVIEQLRALKISFTINGKVYEKIFPVEQGISNSLATFALGADGIVQAYAGKKLIFDENGLTVQAGGIRIQDDSGQVMLGATKEGDLSLTGIITATGGSIGNIEIKDGSLFGQNGNSFKISNDGIIANNITIKNAAKIEDYIQLGDSYLCNPIGEYSKALGERAVLTSGGIVITDQGVIKGGSSDSKSNWEINGNGVANFKDVYADQVHLRNTVLEIGTIQSVGSTMLFTESAVIESISSKDGKETYKLDNMISLKTGDWILVNNEYYQIGNTNEEKFEIKSGTLSQGDVVIKLGPDGGYVLSACGANNSQSGYANSNSITLSKFQLKEGMGEFTSHLILGDLGEKGTGLWADNVYLEGALTTKVPIESNSPTYAGINTLNQAKSQDKVIQGNIVFWAGAENQEGIESAPFYVTDSGGLFAKKAKLVDSLFTGSITTSEIIGDGNDEVGPSLKIKDTAMGIGFYSGDTETLKITNEGLWTKEKQFISIDGSVRAAFETVKVGQGGVDGTNLLNLIGAEVKAKGNFTIENNNYKMEYQQTEKGYDLFISAIEGGEN